MRETLGAIFGPFECGWRSKSDSRIAKSRTAMRHSVLQGTLAECSDQAAIRQGLRLAGRLADLPPKTASQTAKNRGQPAIRLFKRVKNHRAGRPPFWRIALLAAELLSWN